MTSIYTDYWPKQKMAKRRLECVSKKWLSSEKILVNALISQSKQPFFDNMNLNFTPSEYCSVALIIFTKSLSSEMKEILFMARHFQFNALKVVKPQ